MDWREMVSGIRMVIIESFLASSLDWLHELNDMLFGFSSIVTDGKALVSTTFFSQHSPHAQFFII